MDDRNELAVETGIRADVAENFLSGLKGLFESNYIEVPEEKYDLVETLAQTVVDLEEKLDTELNYNIELKQTVEAKTRDEIFSEVVEDLVDTDAERMMTLAENIEFTDENEFKQKLEILKDNYLSEDISTEDEVITEHTDNNDLMSAYTTALSRVAKSANDNKS
jgi:rubrerythrin